VAEQTASARFVTVGGLLKRGVDLDVILNAMVDEVVNQLEADRGTLYLVDRPRHELFSKAAHLPELPEIRLAIGKGVAGAVAKTGKLINLANAYDDPRFDPTFDERTGYKTRTQLVAPIHDKKGDIIGVFQLLNKKLGAFNAQDELMIASLAAQAAEIIEKTSLYAELSAGAARDEQQPLDYRYNFIVGTSTAMRQVYALVEKAAGTTATVILQGETGTGKNLIARAIHLNSDRKDKPLVVVDCTTLPPSLIENELFGHERGAYTGAHAATPGKFELAKGGTVLIDEIGELPLDLQGKLLRVIQEHKFERVGGTRSIEVDFRLIAATNRNLEQLVAESLFRADLYYRIRVLPIVLPSLRQRGAEDIQSLAAHFLEVFAKKHRRRARAFSAGAMARLLTHDWPGNIRQLENCIESAVVLADGPVIDESHLTLPLHPTSGKNKTPTKADLSRPLEQAEQDYVRAVFEDVGRNHSEAARRLQISRNTLSRKLGPRD